MSSNRQSLLTRVSSMFHAGSASRSNEGFGISVRCRSFSALVVAGGTFLFYALVSLILFENMRSGMDLTIFDQGVRELSRFHLPTSSMKSPGMNLWGDHFHPIIVLAAPFYWLWDDPRMLLLVQALAIAITAWVIVQTSRRLYFPDRRLPPVAIGLAFSASLGVTYGAVFDFHEVALGMPILALALAALLSRRQGWVLLWCAVLLLVKEDAGLIAFGVGMVAFLRGMRAVGGIIMATSTAWTLLVIKIIIPRLSPTGTWMYANALGGVGQAWDSAVDAFITDGHLALTVGLMLMACLGLPLRSSVLIAILPNLATRAVSSNVNYWVIHNHYNMLPMVIVVFAAMEVLGTKVKRVDMVAILMVVTAALSAVFGPAPSQAWHAISESRADQARQILMYIPDGAPVAADAYLTPQLTRRHPITQQVRPATALGWPAYRDDLGRPLVADYLVLDYKTTSNMSDGGWTQTAIDYFAARGYRIIHRVGDFVLMRRTG